MIDQLRRDIRDVKILLIWEHNLFKKARLKERLDKLEKELSFWKPL